MLKKFEHTIRDEIGFKAEDFCVVGVSGGADSLALMHLLAEINQAVIVVHVDHALRAESAQDAKFVEDQAEILRLKYEIQKVDTNTFAEENQVSVEEAARILRYQQLFEIAHSHKAAAVVVAHSANDQVETLLMHLIRGSGLSGLRGMSQVSSEHEWDRNVFLLRPLLSVWREDILAYCEDNGLNPIFDRSNLDTTLFRNRIRHELIPFLATYNPSIKKALNRTADTLGADYPIWKQAVDQTWERLRLNILQDGVQVKLSEFQLLSLGLQRAILRQAIEQLRPGLKDIDFRTIQRAIQYLANPKPGKQIDLIAKLILFIEGDSFWIAEWGSNLISPEFPAIKQAQKLEYGKAIEILDGWKFHAEILEDTENLMDKIRANMEPFSAYICIDDHEADLHVRKPQTSDAFQPFGMGGQSKRISDYFMSRKIPKRARKHWPLLLAGETILWVPGLHLAHPARVTKDSKKVIFARLIKGKE